ncbi:PVC-type heme-binding CxxCH protein [Stieleria varia]|nr:PVC-type heme-binding CxxCH protein [Stieleria varia]
MQTFQGRGVMADGSQPTPPDKALDMFRLRDGFQIELMASEPNIAQPLFLSWDSRGRMWVVHYRQYQFPAGLKVIRYDQHLRAVFDRVPDPPPHGTPGKDLITVHGDPDGDGHYETHQPVISGLNIASAVQVGHGGIWVLNPPYLLFYPDANRDDVPDSDPVVHLSGFGLQDTHSIANSMMWGPDGWLYGCNGSTTTGDVSSAVTKGVRFQGQCVWRYHPKTQVFEIYAEGGGNNFSLDIDAGGRVFAGTNGGNTRGWYFPQGSYSEKNWGKHGPLTNPYAFGFFPPMKFKGDGRRFPQAFCVYEGGLYPKPYDGMILAPNAMQNLVWASQRIADGSTYRTEDETNLLESDDHWFRPVYAGVGPDGSMYMADWYDSRLSHVSPIDDWHKSSGRIYRVIPKGSSPAYDGADLHTIPLADLLTRLQHPNKWVRKRAVLELGWREERSALDTLVQQVNATQSNPGDTHGTLESLWAINLLGGLNRERAEHWISHQDPDVRRWVVRLMGDRKEPIKGLDSMAAKETNVQVRSQLAASAKRLPADAALPIIAALLRHDGDIDDPHMPLMIWWAIEAHAERWDLVREMLEAPDVWQLPLIRQVVLARLIGRYAASATPDELQWCAELLQLAPDAESKTQLLVGLSRAFEGRSIPVLPDALQAALQESQERLGQSGLVLAIRQNNDAKANEIVRTLSDRNADLTLQLKLVETLGEVPMQATQSVLIGLATGRNTIEPALQRVAIASLASYDDASIANSLIAAFGSRISDEHDLRSTACRTLASRPGWAKALLRELTEWRLRVDQVPPDVIQQLRSYDDPETVASVEKAFGKSVTTASPEKLAEIQRLQTLVADHSLQGDPAAGKLQFTQRCATCHQLFGEGQKVGPPLDGYERGSTRFWIHNMVDPSLEIREGYQSYLVLTLDGRTVTGMIAAQDETTVTLRTAKGETQKIDREKIEVLRALPASLMPDGLLKDASEQQIRDLLAYLMLGA